MVYADFDVDTNVEQHERVAGSQSGTHTTPDAAYERHLPQ